MGDFLNKNIINQTQPDLWRNITVWMAVWIPPERRKKVDKCILVIHIIKSFGWEQSIYLNLWNLRKRLAVLTGWITTINGFLQIASTLQNLGYDKFPTRAFNQNPIENFLVNWGSMVVEIITLHVLLSCHISNHY